MQTFFPNKKTLPKTKKPSENLLLEGGWGGGGEDAGEKLYSSDWTCNFPFMVHT